MDTSSNRGLRDPEKGSSLFLFHIALLVLGGSMKLGLGTLGNPGPGFIPFIAAGVLACSSFFHFLKETFFMSQRRKPTFGGLWAGMQWRKVIYVSFVLMVYAFFFEKGGFLFCTLCLMMFLLTVTGVKHWYTVLIGSAAVTLLSYVVFDKLLAVGFPAGIFGF